MGCKEVIMDVLTTEKLRKKFKNNFDLCNFSINIARTILMDGAPTTLGDLLSVINERSTAHAKNELSGVTSPIDA